MELKNRKFLFKIASKSIKYFYTIEDEKKKNAQVVASFENAAPQVDNFIFNSKRKMQLKMRKRFSFF